MTISVCIGSSCHVKRSADIIALLRDAIKKLNNDLTLFIISSRCASIIDADKIVVLGVPKDLEAASSGDL